MMRLFILLNLVFGTITLSAQIHHWETVVYDSMKWRYWVGTSDPGANWNAVAFSDASWPQGRGGFGYGDSDDRTTITPTISVFTRRKFNITNRAKIRDALLHVDYDDGFIVYLNGVEVARSTMPPGNVLFNQGSSGLHEALLYQGQAPEGFLVKADQLASLLLPGENTLAVQVHNDNINSSDLTSRVFFSVGITEDVPLTYLPTPDWFTSPITFASNLPIIVINTNGLAIPDDPKIVAHMGIIDNGAGQMNSLNDPFTNYDGRIEIELRGESSQSFPKKSYSIETQTSTGANLNAALLGMPPENDWVLYAPYTDKTMMRDVLAYQLGRDLGNYAPRTRFAEVVINDDYKGVYVLIERIKRDKNRVDIAALELGDLSGDELTGGYLLRVDKLDGNDYPGWTATPTPMLAGANDITFQYFDPTGEELAETQRTYIRNYMRSFQNALTASTFTNNTTGFKSFLDIPSTINFMLVNEIGKNVDGFVFSTYLFKEKDSDGGKLHMGPLWDFNLAFGNVDYWQNSQFAPGWMWNDQQRMFWFRRMLLDPTFTSQLKCRWTELRNSFLTDQYFTNKIDSIANVLQAAQQRNYTRWPILGTYVWPNQFVGATYAAELSFLKTWIQQRLDWMDTNMPGTCDPITSISSDAGVRIFPNPVSESLFVEVDNDLNQSKFEVIDLTGRLMYSETFSEKFEWKAVRQSDSIAGGTYLVRVTTGNSIVVTRIIVQ